MSEKGTNTAGALTRLSLDRRITVFVSLLTIIVVGVIAMVGIPLETFPTGYNHPALNVSVPWANAPTRAVMDKITLPLEEELSTVRNLDGINSWTSTGRANVYLRFKQGADMDVAYREVRDRLERARLLFPDDVERTFIHKEDLSSIPLMFIGVALDPDLIDYYNLVKKEIVLPLSRIDGVATVNANGLQEKEVLIEIDKSRTDSLGLNIYDLAQQLGGDNFTMASGNVRESGKKFLLRSVATYKELDEIQNRRVSPSVRLQDIAEITFEPPEQHFAARVNGKPALAVVVKKEGDANTVQTAQRVREVLEEIKENPRLASLEIQPFFDQGAIIEDSLTNLVGSGKIGGLLAALVLFVFLRQFRLTIIIALSIPLCLLIALVFMYFYGETLNILSILGLVICVGLLVDNSVVVAENIIRLRQAGHSRREACIRGAGEIALAITLATLTTVAVFLPVSLVEGQGKFFMLRLSIPISVSLLASLFVAMIFIPLSVYITFPGERNRQRKGLHGKIYTGLIALVGKFYELTFGNLQTIYMRGLGFFMRRRLDLVLLLIIVYQVTTAIAYKEVQISETQEEDKASFNIGVGAANEFSFEDLGEWFTKVEKILAERKKEYGLSGYFVQFGKGGGRIEGWFDKEIDTGMTPKEVGSKLYKELPKQAGIKLYYSEENQAQQDKGYDVFWLTLQGENAEQLKDIAEQLEPVLLGVKGVIGSRIGNEKAPSELALVIDRDRANAAGANPNMIAGAVGYALMGRSLPRFNYDGRQIPVRIQYREEDRETLTELSNFRIPTQGGGALPISALTDAKMLNSPTGISRRERRVTHSITLELERDHAKEAKENLIAIQGLIDLPEGVTFGAISVPYKSTELDSMKFAGILSVVFIYLLMGFLFESFILPLSIILTIPLAGIGVAWIHYFTEKDMDMLGIVGIILLIGVVVNNGIVLIDYVNRLRKEGMERAEALLKAADQRFRPIILTAMTTIIGMLPLTVSKPSALGMSYKSFGLTLIGGMTTATLLTLLVIPVFYTFFDDARIALGRTLKLLLSRNKSEAADLTAPKTDP